VNAGHVARLAGWVTVVRDVAQAEIGQHDLLSSFPVALAP
jgi:hypothetical protein